MYRQNSTQYFYEMMSLEKKKKKTALKVKIPNSKSNILLLFSTKMSKITTN